MMSRSGGAGRPRPRSPPRDASAWPREEPAPVAVAAAGQPGGGRGGQRERALQGTGSPQGGRRLSRAKLHGLRHMCAGRAAAGGSFQRRALWVFAFCTSLGLLLSWSSNRLLYWLSFPSHTRVHREWSRQLPFPAVTVCNNNPLRFPRLSKGDLYYAGHWLGCCCPTRTAAPAGQRAAAGRRAAPPVVPQAGRLPPLPAAAPLRGHQRRLHGPPGPPARGHAALLQVPWRALRPAQLLLRELPSARTRSRRSPTPESGDRPALPSPAVAPCGDSGGRGRSPESSPGCGNLDTTAGGVAWLPCPGLSPSTVSSRAPHLCCLRSPLGMLALLLPDLTPQVHRTPGSYSVSGVKGCAERSIS
nr:uncharacterized protein LOC116157750 [Camelus dromedarius]